MLFRSLGALLKESSKEIKNIKYNSVSPNSSKFPSFSFTYSQQQFDIIIARGANKGENFETTTVGDLKRVFAQSKEKVRVGDKTSKNYQDLIAQLDEACSEFADVEIVSVEQRKGSTKKEGVPIEKLGAIIGDIVLTDASGKNWYISLKNMDGDTFSSYSGAASLFDANGDLQPNSAGEDFLSAFGADLNKIQQGFDLRNNKKKLRPHIPVKKPNQEQMKQIFERAWGMNYFYVRKTSTGWKVFWMSRKKLNELIGNMVVTDIKYPNEQSKQISIFCESPKQKYLIELRNSKAGEYPNDTKFKVK
mgnify:CR=1 FL=1